MLDKAGAHQERGEITDSEAVGARVRTPIKLFILASVKTLNILNRGLGLKASKF